MSTEKRSIGARRIAVSMTLSAAAIAKADRLAQAEGKSRSRLVEDLIVNADAVGRYPRRRGENTLENSGESA